MSTQPTKTYRKTIPADVDIEISVDDAKEIADDLGLVVLDTSFSPKTGYDTIKKELVTEIANKLFDKSISELEEFRNNLSK